MSRKLQWKRSPIMQTQPNDKDTCWAAVIESVLAQANNRSDCAPLSKIEDEFRRKGGAFGAHGIKDFGEALKAFDLYNTGAKEPQGFKRLYQTFNFIKYNIDNQCPIIVGWKLTWDVGDGTTMTAKHAGMIFGYDDTGDTDKVFVMEPIKINRAEWYRRYADEPFDMATAFNSFGNMKGKITELYATKRPWVPSSGLQATELMN